MLHHNFTRHCTCCRIILPHIAFAAGLFYQVLHLPASQFYWALHLLQHNFTGHCTCCSTILPDIAFAAGLFYWALHLLHLPAGPFDRSFGVWETHPIWDNLTAFFDLGYLGYLLPPNQGSGFFCAWPGPWLCIHQHTQLGAAVGYCRASLLHICYGGCLEYVSEGILKYLYAFLGPDSHNKWKYIPLSWQLIGLQKSGQMVCIQC